MSSNPSGNIVSISEVFGLAYDVSNLPALEGVSFPYDNDFVTAESTVFLRGIATALAKRDTKNATDFTVRRIQQHLMDAPHSHCVEYYGDSVFGITLQEYVGLDMQGKYISADALTLTPPSALNHHNYTRIIRLDDGRSSVGPRTIAVHRLNSGILASMLDGLNGLMDEYLMPDPAPAPEPTGPTERLAGSPILRLITSEPDA